MTKNEIGTIVGLTKAEIAKLKKAELEAMLAEHHDKSDAAEDSEEISMSDHMKKYRENYTASKTASGTASMHNGSKLAILLSGSTPEAVVATAERVLDLKSGELATKYAHLNPGSRRMNAGNRLKFALKRGDIKMDDIAKALAS